MPTWRGTVNSLWSNAGNWLTDGSGSGVPTATTSATFDSSSPNCTVDTAAPVCSSIDFTGYTGTITMNNTTNLLVGSTTVATTANLTLSSGMTILGTGGIATRNNTTVNINTNGKRWPNFFGICTTSAASANNTVNILSNITIGGNCQIGSGTFRIISFSGAFDISIEGNFVHAFTGANGAGAVPLTTAATAPKIVLAGTGTWSTSGLFNSRGLSFGLNIDINTTGTITIADNCYITSLAQTFRHVQGTVITQGTFYILYNGGSLNLDLKGSSSSTATTQSSTGVNFNNVVFNLENTPSAAAITLVSDICIVGTFNWTSSFGQSGTFSYNGGHRLTGSGRSVYILGNSFTVNAQLFPSSAFIGVTFVFQGAGNLDFIYTSSFTVSNAVPPVVNIGLAYSNIQGHNFVINKSGTVTFKSQGNNRGGFIPLGTLCGLTYTAGTLVYESTSLGAVGGIYAATSSTITGLSSSNVKVPLFLNVGLGTSTTVVNVNGSPALDIDTNIFVVYAANQTHGFGGTCDINFDKMYYSHPGGSNGAGLIYFAANRTYTVKQLLSLLATNTSNACSVRSIVNGTKAILTLSQGAVQDVYYIGANDINSSLGQTIWTRKGIVTNTFNWDIWAYPKTVHQTFITE